MTVEIDMAYGSDKKVRLYGDGNMPGLVDFEEMDDEDVAVYGLGQGDEIYGIVVETPSAKMYQFDHPDEEKFDRMNITLHDYPDDISEDICNYLKRTDVNERDQELVRHFWNAANPTLEFGT